MEEETLLKQPADRRLGDNSSLPPGPPGAEFDTEEFALKNAPPAASATKTNENSTTERTSRRHSPSASPPSRKRGSKSRGRRSPSPLRNRNNRNRRSPSPARRTRYRDYSPDRRRYGRRSPDRRRYGSRGMGRDRYRGRGRSSSRSLSRSRSPPPRRGGRWSPKNKPTSPPPPQPATLVQPPQIPNQPAPPPYGVMAPQLYSDAYGTAPGYNQYGVPPPQPGFVQSNEAYAATSFSAAYPPPGTWGVDAYGQQQWMPPPSQMRQMPQTQQSQPPTSPAPVTPVTSNPTLVATNAPPPLTVTKSMHVLPDAAPGTIEANPQHDAVAQEAENQRDEIRKQRTSYLKKTAVLKKELKMLKEQRKGLHSGKAPASPTTRGFIDENEKLQSQIQKKLNTIENVIDMLTGIIGEENLDKDDEPAEEGDTDFAAKGVVSTKSSDPSGVVNRTSERNERGSSPSGKKTRSSSSSSDESSSDTSSSSSESSSSSDNETANKPDNDDDSSPERLKKKVIESMRNKEKELFRNKAIDTKIPTKKERFNYVFYDPEMHWCQTCNIFPKTAKDYLNHLHSKDHMDRESIETPWHADMVSDQFPTYENVPTKRTPIRGLTFFVPATSWFCKLCNIWMGDLHCASTHLKSQLHANKYNSFLEENPHYEVNWLADRQKILNDQKLKPLPQQITSVSTTAAERKKSKKDDEKSSKKRKKKSDRKQKKKKKKSNKKRKKGDSDSTSSSSSNSSTSTDTDEPKKKKITNIEIKDLDNPNPAVSIRLSMRKQENVKQDDFEVPQPPPPPPLKISGKSEQMQDAVAAGKWTVVQEGVKQKISDVVDDGIMQEWNTVQPVISESEKKLLEQLKGKLKSKSNIDNHSAANTSSGTTAAKPDVEKENRGRGDRHDRRDNRDIRENRDNRDQRTSRRRTLSRSPTRSRSRGRDYRRHMRRSRSRSRGRMSPRGGWRGRRRHDRSRSRSLRRRSRSNDRRRRSSRSRSASRGRVEKPIVRQPEFRPRVPEKDKEKDKKTSENKEKKEKAKLKAPPASSTVSSNASGKKLPFIGKMPVFKKQTSGQLSEGEKQLGEQHLSAGYMYPMDATSYTSSQQRPPAPTAAQIQMAMMEDAYGNAPPFHPDAGMMVDYEDLMPDPVQFVNIMGQAPPPPPPQASDDKDMLPPGIDEEESEQFMAKPIAEAPPPPPPGKEGVLPKDLEDALNIIFPGDKKPEGTEDKTKISKGETQIIDDDPKLEPHELAKDGIHLVTLEETSQLGIDEASQMSMNEPLVFNRPAATTILLAADMDIEDSNSHKSSDDCKQLSMQKPQAAVCVKEESNKNEKEKFEPILSSKNSMVEDSDTLNNIENNGDDYKTVNAIQNPDDVTIQETVAIVPKNVPSLPENIPIPTPDISTPELSKSNELCEFQLSTNPDTSDLETLTEIDLADIPQPPPSPTESEKNRRQEELDDLAMLGIDADDMAAQCM